MRKHLNYAAVRAAIASVIAAACKLNDPTPEPPSAVSLDIFPSSRELHAMAGGTVEFAVQAKAASGEASDGVDVFLAMDESAPLVFETPSSSTTTVRSTTRRDTVTTLSVDGVVPVRIIIRDDASVGVYPVFCGLTSLGNEGADAGTSPRPVSRVNIFVDELDSSAELNTDGGFDAN